MGSNDASHASAALVPFAPGPQPSAVVATLSQYGVVLLILLVATVAWRLFGRSR